MGIGISLVLLPLGVVLVVHHRIPPDVVPFAVGLGWFLIAASVAVFGLALARWSSWGDPVCLGGDGEDDLRA
jgi:hypothetical protein